MAQTGSKLSAKLAASVRQAKEQATKEEVKTETKPSSTTPTVEAPLPLIPSRRTWPD